MLNRNTFQKDLVIKAAKELANHPTPEEIYNYVRERCPNISKGTVYRNIGVLAGEGVLKKIEIPNAPDRVDYNTSDHYHIICNACGRVFDINFPFFDDMAVPENTQGFRILSHDIMFKGICPKCQ
ncbi:MAG: transcriptional repressor [Oscillospiraceae bacterium]